LTSQIFGGVEKFTAIQLLNSPLLGVRLLTQAYKPLVTRYPEKIKILVQIEAPPPLIEGRPK
jgi:hypothetical protein